MVRTRRHIGMIANNQPPAWDSFLFTSTGGCTQRCAVNRRLMAPLGGLRDLPRLSDFLT